jgi:hypothetical protein
MGCHHEHFHHHRFGLPRIIAMVVAGIAIATLFALAFGWLVMLLWNWLMPVIFGLRTITYWQGFGLTVLAKLFFGGIHGKHPHRSPFGNHHDRGPAPWRWDKPDMNSPGGDRRNWIYYREYWNERGIKDFEEYLNSRKTSEGNHEE